MRSGAGEAGVEPCAGAVCAAPRGRAAAAGRAACAALLLLLAACGHMPAIHSPWHHAPPAPPPPPVHELDVSSSALDPATVRQTWKRHTLVVDLSAASGRGSLTLKPAAGTGWPVRLALRVTPGSIGELEVRGEQRQSLPIIAAGKPVDLELAPDTYTAKTRELTVSWAPSVPPAP